ncbi:MAG: methyltransferase regulatory domain-containing protein, partial [Gemmatimonadaceae bacterium]
MPVFAPSPESNSPFSLPGTLDLRASYEAVAYSGAAIRFAEPDAIAAMATLHGLTPPAPDRCRVLDLGCASATNLIAMAFRLPKSTFVGVDFAPSQIESGRWVVSELGLRNVDLQARSIADIGEADGVFDYIICHGVYSWVPPDVQDAILRVCSSNLAPNGVAYVSYNTYPGWHRRGMLRDMLMFNDDPSRDPGERVARARALASALASVDSANPSAHARILREEAAQLAEQADRHLFHEQLEAWNDPVYFAEFILRAGLHHLRYVADVQTTAETEATAAFREALGDTVDPIRLEQYLDFVRGRQFRKSLLCHDSAQPSSELQADAPRRLVVRSLCAAAEPNPEDAARGPGVAAFQAMDGAKVTTNNPLVIAALRALMAAAPAALSLEELERAATAAVASDDGADATLCAALLSSARGGLVEFRVLPWKWPVAPSALPKASALARWEALHS